MVRAVANLVILTLLLGQGFLSVGCVGGSRTAPLRLDFPADARATAVDVQHYGGTLRIEADPHASGIGIETKVRLARWVEPNDRQAVLDAAHVAAEVVERDGRAVLVVEGATDYPDDTASEIDIRITMPTIDGTRVRQIRGNVTLVNVAGATEVNVVDGDVQISTNHAMVDPVLLVTGRGRIAYVVDPASTGRFDLEALGGKVTYKCQDGITRDMQALRNRFHGILNDGDNAVKIKSHEGDVVVRVQPRAGHVINPAGA
jgi:hypothetical protein